MYLDGNDTTMDILRLTCIEGGISFDSAPKKTVLRAFANDFQIMEPKAPRLEGNPQ